MTTEAPDSADLDALLELERSPGYALVVKRITAELERKRLDLEGMHAEALTATLRGYISALRTVLNIPVILKGEISRQLKEQQS